MNKKISSKQRNGEDARLQEDDIEDQAIVDIKHLCEHILGAREILSSLIHHYQLSSIQRFNHGVAIIDCEFGRSTLALGAWYAFLSHSNLCIVISYIFMLGF